MSVPHTVAEVLNERVTLEVEGIDRMYLNVYVPQLQREQGVAGIFRFHRGHQFASSALMESDQQGPCEGAGGLRQAREGTGCAVSQGRA